MSGEVGSSAAGRVPLVECRARWDWKPNPTRVTRGRGGRRHPSILHNNDARWSVTFLSGFSCAQ